MNDYETIQRNRNITVGIFVLIGIAAFFWLIFKFGKLPVWISGFKSFQVKIQFPSAPGISQNTPVRFCGYQIGRVTDIEPPRIVDNLATHQQYHQTIVVIDIDKKYNDIPSNVEAKLMSRGLGSDIELREMPSEANQPQARPLVKGSILQGSAGVTSGLFPEDTQKKLDELTRSLIVLINNANEIIGKKENKDNLTATLAHMSDVTKEAALTLKELQKLVISGTGASEELSKAIADTRLILDKVNSGEGTAGRLVNDGKLYENLIENTQQLQLLLGDMRTFINQAREKGVKVKFQ